MILIKKIYKTFKVIPIITNLAISYCLTLIYFIVVNFGQKNTLDDILMGPILLSIFILLPALLTLENIILLIVSPKSNLYESINNRIEICGLIIGSIFFSYCICFF